MKKTGIFAIYAPTVKGKTYDKTTKNFRDLYNKGGVYCIFRRNKNGKIQAVYVGKSLGNAAKSCLRHFYFYNDARERQANAGSGAQRVSFENEKNNPKKFFVMFVYIDQDTKTKPLTAAQEEEVSDKEKELIQLLTPIFNTNLKTGEFDPDLVLQSKLEREAASAYGRYDEYKEEYQKYYIEKEEAEEKGTPPPLEEPPF